MLQTLPPSTRISSLLPETVQDQLRNSLPIRAVSSQERAHSLTLPARKDLLVHYLQQWGYRIPGSPVLAVGEKKDLPTVQGYHWYSLSDQGFLSQVWVAQRDETTQMDYLSLVIQRNRSPEEVWEAVGSWPLPVPVLKDDGQLSWSPQCFVRVEHLRNLPLWLLGNPQRVYLTGKAARYHMTEQEIEKRKSFLTGPEILQRISWDASFKMSVAGWPLRYVPIRYLYFMASEGTSPRRGNKLEGKAKNIRWRDASLSQRDVLYIARPEPSGVTYNQSRVVWKDEILWTKQSIYDPFKDSWEEALTPRKVRRMTVEYYEVHTLSPGFYRIIEEPFGAKHRGKNPLMETIHRYLDSPHGKERLRQQGMILPWHTSLSRGEFFCLLQSEEGRQKLQTLGLINKHNELQRIEWVPLEDDNVWRETQSRQGWGTFTGRNLIQDREFDFAEDWFFRPGPKMAMIFHKIWERQNRDRRIAREEFSFHDQDRYGPWGSPDLRTSPPTPGTKQKGLKVKIQQAILEGDTDPTPREFRLTGLGEWSGRSNTQEPPWISPWDRDDRDWYPPAPPQDEKEALQRAYRVLEWLEGIQKFWEKEQDKEDLGYGRPLNRRDRRELQAQREEDIDLIWARTGWWEILCADLLGDHLIVQQLTQARQETLQAIQESRGSSPPPAEPWSNPHDREDLVWLLSQRISRIAFKLFPIFFPEEPEGKPRTHDKKTQARIEKAVGQIVRESQIPWENRVPVLYKGQLVDRLQPETSQRNVRLIHRRKT